MCHVWTVSGSLPEHCGLRVPPWGSVSGRLAPVHGRGTLVRVVDMICVFTLPLKFLPFGCCGSSPVNVGGQVSSWTCVLFSSGAVGNWHLGFYWSPYGLCLWPVTVPLSGGLSGPHLHPMGLGLATLSAVPRAGHSVGWVCSLLSPRGLGRSSLWAPVAREVWELTLIVFCSRNLLSIRRRSTRRRRRRDQKTRRNPRRRNLPATGRQSPWRTALSMRTLSR